MLSREVGIDPEEFKKLGYKVYNDRYEPYIQDLIRERGFQAKSFLAKKGDVLFWHANLFHGGAKRKDIRKSRKAMVCHYFAQGVQCYHDLSGLPANFDSSISVAVAPIFLPERS